VLPFGRLAYDAGDQMPSVPQAIHDMLSVVYAAEENGEYPDLGRLIIGLEIDNKILAGEGANARSPPRARRGPLRQ